jgi:DmsE family decaheme c-type cytochrome
MNWNWLRGAVAALFIFSFPMLILSAKEYGGDEIVKKSATCLDCHQEMAAGLDGSVHKISGIKEMSPAIKVGCIGCHDGWEKHLDDPSAETIGKIKELPMVDQARVCGRCHMSEHQAAMVADDPHGRADIGCLDCHSIHNNKNRALTKDDNQNYCGTCHQPIAAEFKKRSFHPLESGNIRCVDCHKLGDPRAGGPKVGIDWTCENCHGDKAGPHIYEHQAANEYSINGGGCMECHEPHGSANDRLLIRPGNNLCLQCHEIPPVHRTQHSGLGMKFDCVFCHSEIHGSYDNGIFLDPDLGIKLFPDCYQSGCHNINN